MPATGGGARGIIGGRGLGLGGVGRVRISARPVGRAGAMLGEARLARCAGALRRARATQRIAHLAGPAHRRVPRALRRGLRGCRSGHRCVHAGVCGVGVEDAVVGGGGLRSEGGASGEVALPATNPVAPAPIATAPMVIHFERDEDTPIALGPGPGRGGLGASGVGPPPSSGGPGGAAPNKAARPARMRCSSAGATGSSTS